MEGLGGKGSTANRGAWDAAIRKVVV